MFGLTGPLAFLTISGILSGVMAILSWVLFNAVVPEINHLASNIRATIFSLVWAAFEALLAAVGMRRFARKWRKRISALEKKID